MSKYHDIEKDGMPKIDGRYLIKSMIPGQKESESIHFDECINGKFSTFWHLEGEAKVVGWWENDDKKFEIEKSIALLEKSKSLLHVANEEINSVFLSRPCYNVEKIYSITIDLLKKIQNKGVDLTKKYQVGELFFDFEFHGGELRLSIEYAEEIGKQIYDSYSGSWTTQYSELQNWFNNVVVDDLGFPLGTKDLKVDKDKLYLYTDDYLDNMVDKIKKAIYLLSKPSNRLQFIIDNHIAYIRKKIEWYNESEDNGHCVDAEGYLLSV